MSEQPPPTMDDYTDPEGPDPEGIPDPMPEELQDPPKAGEEVGEMSGEAPTS